jgi:hypothetical protein
VTELSERGSDEGAGRRDSPDAGLASALDLVRRFVTQHHSTAVAALLAGSRGRGEAGPESDYDVVVLFQSLPDGAWREMSLFEGKYVEVFAHDLATLAYFCRELDRPSGVAALPTMVAEGAQALPSSPLLDAAREIARETLRLGPPPLDPAAKRARRFAITDLASALRDGRDRGLLIAAGGALYSALADFALRASGRWSASGKAFPLALEALDPALAMQFEIAFTALFAKGVVAPAQALVDTVLAPYGGRLRDGFRVAAPTEWRSG